MVWPLKSLPRAFRYPGNASAAKEHRERSELLLHELAGRVSKQQMDIVHLKQGGYGIREIARTQKVPMRRIKELLAEVHDVLLDICYG